MNTTRLKTEHFLSDLSSFCLKNRIVEPVVVAASKTKTQEDLLDAHAGGVNHFGENYLHELQQKAGCGGMTTHFIGHIQGRKIKEIIHLSDVIHTFCQKSHLEKAQKAAETAQKQVNIFIQVNIGREAQKSGAAVKDLAELVSYAQQSPNLRLLGFMAIPPAEEDPAPYFKEMQALAAQYQLPHLSMGMSHDWQEALLHGATYIRLGTAIFGARPPKTSI